MDLLSRLWRGLMRPKQLVGSDQAGNHYYRRSTMISGALIEKRWMEFKGEPDPTAVPVEWISWLSGRRKEAPTSEEIMEMETQRKLVKMKAALLEKEEEKRRFRAKTLQQEMNADLKPLDMNRLAQKFAATNTTGLDGEAISGEAGNMMSEEGKSDSLENEAFENQEMQSDSEGHGESFKPGTWRPN